MKLMTVIAKNSQRKTVAVIVGMLIKPEPHSKKFLENEMKKLLLGMILIVVCAPYLFLLSDVRDIPGSEKEYDCVISKVQYEESYVGLGSVYYNVGFFTDNKRIILPYFLLKGDVVYADCGEKEIILGMLNDEDYSIGVKIHLQTSKEVIKFLDKEIKIEESISMFSKSSEESK